MANLDLIDFKLGLYIKVNVNADDLVETNRMD